MLLLVHLFSLTCLFSAGSGDERPNVLFLVVDDLRPKLGCYGESNMVTPNIDNLASKSVVFERAYIQQAVCSPSRTSFLTGRRPDTTHIFDLSTYFRNITGNFTTLPQHFKNNGYITQSVGKIFHPGKASGNTDDYPYSWSYPAYHGPTTGLRVNTCPGPDGKLYNYARCPVDLNDVPQKSLPDIQNTDFAVQFLQNRTVDRKPFFLAVGYHKPHLAFRFPKEYLDLYPMSKIHLAPNLFYPPWLPEVAWTPFDELRKYDDISPMNLSYPFGPVPDDYQLKLRQAYSACVSFTDAQMGRVLSALDELGFSNNTIITLHGDHGWQLGEHQEWCKHTNFDIATRIPMMIYVPGVTAGQASSTRMFPYFDALSMAQNKQASEKQCASNVCRHSSSSNSKPMLSTDVLVEAVDLYATISELAGLDVPPTCPTDSLQVSFCSEGSSLAPVIKNVTSPSPNPDLKWKPAVFSQYPRPSFVPQNNSILPSLADIRIMGYTMKTAKHRYTEWVAYDPKTFTADWTHVYARELYNHVTDPEENLNVVDVVAYKNLATQLSGQLRDGWRKAMPKT